ncbi:MAG: alkaline phosphatase family protein [Solirubrobacterales bacterium]
MRRLLPLLALLAVLVLAPPAGASEQSSPPKLGHVFVIVLENENAADTFGPDAPAYLAKTLPSMGAYVPNYYATGHLSLDNYISMVSGQAPNIQTQADCIFYTDFFPGIPVADGQVLGSGCVYPSSVQTIADQLETAGLDWAGYMEDMAAKAPAEPATCRHPAIGARDDTQSAEVGDQYATRHNPFMYFHSIIDDQASCDAHVVDYTQLAGDLKRVEDTPAFSFITPNLCHDGHDEPCINGEPGGLESANQFLEQAVPPILDSPAFERRGLLVITFDEAEATGATADSSACCNEQPGPNTPSPGGLTVGPGGGKIGAVMISPCIRPGTTSDIPYNHYSFLRSIEDGFGLSHLGYAGQDRLTPFGADIYSRADCSEKARLKVKPKHPRRGEKQLVRFRVKSGLDRCREGVQINFAGKRAKTDARGRAKLRARINVARTAKASKEGCLPAKARVRPR